MIAPMIGPVPGGYLATQGITGELLRIQSALLAMHESFLLAALLALVALGMMCLVPPRRRETKEQPEHVSQMELVA